MSKTIAIGEKISLKPILRLGMTPEEMATKNIIVASFDEESVTDEDKNVYKLKDYIVY